MQRESANTEQTNEFLSLIKKRWSPKDFDLEKNFSPENLQLLFEAARWAPSSRNEQPWNYILVKKDEPEQFEKMIDVLIESNKTWASKASVLVLTVASLRLSHNGSNNFYALYDLGASVASLSLQAIELDIFTHQMGGFNHYKAKDVFHLSENYSPVSILALGYLPEDVSFQNRKEELLTKRKRKSLNEFVFRNNWGNPFFEVNEFQKN